MVIRVLTYNIHKGFDWINRRYVLEDIQSLIKQSEAEIVCLQEVVGENQIFKKKGLIDTQFEYLADSIWSNHSYAQNAIYDHGHHGNLILSKYPIVKWENTDLTTNRFEKRGLLSAEINIPEIDKTINVMCAHLNLLQGGRTKQYRKIQQKILQLNPNNPLILAGDFNDWNRKSAKTFFKGLNMQESHKTVKGYFAKTYPAAFPVMSLDRIYVRNIKIHEAHTMPHILRRGLSDHLPIYCELEL